jgi:CubicO group peptidase (beta-lactamase class C family)
VAAILAGALVLSLVAGYALLRSSPVWGVIDLFGDRRPENFRGLHLALPAHPIAAGGDTWAFARDERPLPERYRFDDEERSLGAFLQDSETTGLVVARDGVILHESYAQGNDPQSLATSFSVAKPFVAALVGIAIEQGFIGSVDDAISDYVPELIGSGYEGVAIRDVLTMSSGVAFDEAYDTIASDVMRLPLRVFGLRQSAPAILAGLVREREPGTFHHYASSDALALGLLVMRATGKTAAAFLEETIWVPAGMEAAAAWNTDLHGHELTYAFLSATLRDYARFGRLVLNEGRRDDRQVIPAAWLHDSLHPAAPHLQPDENPASTSAFGYGYQWWIPDGPDGDVVAIGIWGQFVYVHPGAGIVIAKTSTDPGFGTRDRETVAVFRAIARALAADR